MNSSSCPLLWYVCRACREVFPDTQRLTEHKKQNHFEDYEKVKCIVFEERLFDSQWVPSDRYFAQLSPDSKTENEIFPEKLYRCCNCTLSATLAPDREQKHVAVGTSDDLCSDSASASISEPTTVLMPIPKETDDKEPKSQLNPYVALKKLTAHELNVALKAHSSDLRVLQPKPDIDLELHPKSELEVKPEAEPEFDSKTNPESESGPELNSSQAPEIEIIDDDDESPVLPVRRHKRILVLQDSDSDQNQNQRKHSRRNGSESEYDGESESESDSESVSSSVSESEPETPSETSFDSLSDPDDDQPKSKDKSKAKQRAESEEPEFDAQVMVNKEVGAGEEFLLTEFSENHKGQVEFRVKLSTDIFEGDKEDSELRTKNETQTAIVCSKCHRIEKKKKIKKDRKKRENDKKVKTNQTNRKKKYKKIHVSKTSKQSPKKQRKQSQRQPIPFETEKPVQIKVSEFIEEVQNLISTLQISRENFGAKKTFTRFETVALFNWLQFRQTMDLNCFEFSIASLFEPDLSSVTVSTLTTISEENPIVCRLCRTKLVCEAEFGNHARNCWIHNKDRHIFCIACHKNFSYPLCLQAHLTQSKHYETPLTTGKHQALIFSTEYGGEEKEIETVENETSANANISLAQEELREALLPLSQWLSRHKSKYPDSIRIFPDPTKGAPKYANKYPKVCSLCKTNLRTETEVKMHIKICWAFNKWKHRYCIQCCVAFRNVHFLLDHVRAKHSQGRVMPSFFCATCDQAFLTKIDLLSHLDSFEEFGRNMSHIVTKEFYNAIEPAIGMAEEDMKVEDVTPSLCPEIIPSGIESASNVECTKRVRNFHQIAYTIREFVDTLNGKV